MTGGNWILVVWLLLGSACTTSRWIIQDEPANDLSESKLIRTVPVLSVKREPTPEHPVAVFEFRNVNTVEFPLRVEQRRYVQSYRPRYGFMLFGLGVSAGLFYIANSSVLGEEIGSGQKSGINAAAGVLAAAAVFNLKPHGKPVYTGETRLLHQTGIGTRSDTVGRPTSAPVVETLIYARYNGISILDGLRKRGVNQEIRIDMVGDLPFRSFETTDPGKVELLITTQQNTFTHTIPVETFLKRYARIARRNTPIRSAPVVSSTNIVTTVAEASLLPWISSADGWHQVSLGLTTVYIRSEDAALVWMPASGVSGMVISTDQRFGDVDVERGIPTTVPIQRDAAAVIIANQNYANPDHANRFALRSVELMKQYYHHALGVPVDRIRVVTDVPSSQNGTWSRFQRNNIWSELALDPDNTRLFVYVVGRGATAGGRAVLLPVDAPRGDPVDIAQFLEYLGSLPTRSTHVLIESDFSVTLDGSLLSQGSYDDLSRNLLSQRQGWVWFASDVRQPSGAYTTTDLRTDRIHGLMTYFFCKALQEEHVKTSDILAYVNRNLTFTSRRLHNRAQDSRFFGDATLWLVDYP